MEHIDIMAMTEACNGKISERAAFARDVIRGLTSQPKYLLSKYFYDEAGDRIFQEIMACEEYYPFACELEIFRQRSADLASLIQDPSAFDLIELGAGDCTKSSHLLKYLVNAGIDFTFMPIDISGNMIGYLQRHLPLKIPGLKIKGLNGDYFSMLERASHISGNRKVVLFLGSNLGNMPLPEARAFCGELRRHLRAGDMALIGLDLKKDPDTILAAYNDKGGITRRFNLNLLSRINRELDADFDPGQFKHFPVYDPSSGACKSYLVSIVRQDVIIRYGGREEIIHFAKDEEIFMEISQKYTVEQIGSMAGQASFQQIKTWCDSRGWFIDSLWQAV